MSSVIVDRLGPRGRRGAMIANVVVGVVALGAIVLLLSRLAAKGQLEAQRWAILLDPGSGVPQTLGAALLKTLEAALVAMVISLLVGAVLAALRLSRRRWLSVPTAVVVEVFRGVPLLLLMLFAALALPSIGLDLDVFVMVVGALVVYNSAVISEIIRAGIAAIPAGQSEAAAAMGMRPLRILLRILLPQSIPAMAPLLVSQLVILLKDTSIGYVIGYSELLRSGRSLVEFYGNRYSLQIYVAVALLYILTNVVISVLAKQLSRRSLQRRPRPPRGGAVPLQTATIPVTPSGGPSAPRRGQTS